MENVGNTWSNLIMPYQSHTTYQIPNTNDVVEVITRKENAIQSTENVKLEKQEIKKKNPYSIEELLKKPVKKSKPLDLISLGYQQPFGVVLENNKENNCIRDNNVRDSNSSERENSYLKDNESSEDETIEVEKDDKI